MCKFLPKSFLGPTAPAFWQHPTNLHISIQMYTHTQFEHQVSRQLVPFWYSSKGLLCFPPYLLNHSSKSSAELQRSYCRNQVNVQRCSKYHLHLMFEHLRSTKVAVISSFPEMSSSLKSSSYTFIGNTFFKEMLSKCLRIFVQWDM